MSPEDSIPFVEDIIESYTKEMLKTTLKVSSLCHILNNRDPSDPESLEQNLTKVYYYLINIRAGCLTYLTYIGINWCTY